MTAGSSFNQFGSYQATVYTGGGDYPPIIPDYVAASPTALSAIDANITDTFTVLGLNSVTINGLYHPHAGDLTATFSHTDATTNQTVTIELLDRIGRTSTSSTGTSAEAFGDFTFAPGGGDISAVAAAAVTAAASVGGTPLIDPTQSYAPFTNDTAGQSLTLTGNFALFNGMNVSGPWTLTIADRNAGSTGSFSGFSFNVAPTTGTLTGNIALEGVDDLSATNAAAPLGTFHIGLRAPGSLTEVRGYNVTLNTASGSASGSYSIPDVPTGTYDVWIKGSKNLAVLVPNVVISTAGATVSDVLLNGGDVDNDNTVGPTDFATFVSVYNSSAAIPGTGYDPAADFNFDGAVDPTDFNIFVGDYNTAGAI